MSDIPQRVARLESDVHNLCDLVSGDIRNTLTTINGKLDGIQVTLGAGQVRFQEHTDKIKANTDAIAAMKASRHDRMLFLWFPLIASILASGAIGAFVLFVSHTSKG